MQICRTFQWLWKAVGQNLDRYTGFPKLIGECGGKNYHFVHPTADVDSVVTSSIRSAFEYQGQKCSACSRMYVPESLWPKVKEGLAETQKSLKVGTPLEFDTFMSAVIDGKSFSRIKSYIDHAKSGPNTKVRFAMEEERLKELKVTPDEDKLSRRKKLYVYFNLNIL